MRYYILCKNEAPNIRKCIEALRNCGINDVVVLDSGSTDGTLEILKSYPVTVLNYTYTNHCDAYNYITRLDDGLHCGVLDADMEMNPDLAAEISGILPNADVLISPLRMYVDGRPLLRGSLCPPKPFVFRSGKDYFESVGHGEKLTQGHKTQTTKAFLAHNDLKPYSAYLNSQVRYAEKFMERAKDNKLTWRDKLRLKSPLLILITPLYSLFIKGGIFYKSGWKYALDRLIAEAVMYRKSVDESIKRYEK